MQIQQEEAVQTQRRFTRYHIIQSLLAGAYILLVFWIMDYFHSDLAVASLGASAFIVFSSPAAQASRPRLMIGGYFLGIVSGLLAGGLSLLLEGRLPLPVYIPACAFAVFISMLLMTTLNLKHPPSAAFAVAVTIDANPVLMSLAGLGCILLLCVLSAALKKHLRNL